MKSLADENVKDLETTMEEVQTAESDVLHDFWKRGKPGEIIRVHRRPRLLRFTPIGDPTCPVDLRELSVERMTKRDRLGVETDFWVGTRAMDPYPQLWTGETTFFLKKVRGV